MLSHILNEVNNQQLKKSVHEALYTKRINNESIQKEMFLIVFLSQRWRYCRLAVKSVKRAFVYVKMNEHFHKFKSCFFLSETNPDIFPGTNSHPSVIETALNSLFTTSSPPQFSNKLAVKNSIPLCSPLKKIPRKKMN